MAYQKEIVTVRLAVSPETATYEFGLSDANAEHPLCVYCVTGRVPMAPFTQANINAIKSFCGSTVFPIVAADAGYTNVP
jgi:hypothetical protein